LTPEVRLASGFIGEARHVAGGWTGLPVHEYRLLARCDHDRARPRPSRLVDRIHPPSTLAIDGPIQGRGDHVVAISSRCVHVGCPVRYVTAAQSFVCGCHGGVYNFRGIRTGGPPPRPLDRFYTLIHGEQVPVGPRYGVNNELRRFSPREPGAPPDGIEPVPVSGPPSTPPAPPGATS
jgi:nitrite reductase/ring-hydroxylating ferredoxin subunit